MSTIGTPGLSGAHAADEVTVQLPVLIHICNRLGRSANPPRFSIADWFRPGRRR